MHGLEKFSGYHCPRWEELPSIPLYMDQVILVLGETLAPLLADGDGAVTKSMINNYVKQKLVTPPQKKKYTREHIATLIIVGVLKRVLSMPEIAALLRALRKEFGLEAAYDLFCVELEGVLALALAEEQISLAAQGASCVILRAALTAWIGKLLLLENLSAAPYGK